MAFDSYRIMVKQFVVAGLLSFPHHRNATLNLWACLLWLLPGVLSWSRQFFWRRGWTDCSARGGCQSSWYGSSSRKMCATGPSFASVSFAGCLALAAFGGNSEAASSTAQLKAAVLAVLLSERASIWNCGSNRFAILSRLWTFPKCPLYL